MSLFSFSKKYRASIVVLVIIAFVAGYGVAGGFGSYRLFQPTASPSTRAHDAADLDLFWRVWDTVDAKYVDTTKLVPRHMLYGAIKGIVKSLGDPHSEFLDPEESKEFRESLSGSLSGIGAEVGMRDDVLTIISPLRGSPAEKAGLLPGDQIFKIDGQLATDYSVTDAVKRIRGAIGTTVRLTILRGGEIEPREVIMTRADIHIDSVASLMRDDGIAVVTVSTFAEDTAAAFTTTLIDLAAKHPMGLVLDLRFNGGGFLDAAIDMTSKLLATGDVVTIKERGKPDQTIGVTGTPLLPDTPLVVLINGGSASASEIMTGALQDAKRATVVGETSFGKGTVQELIDTFPDGSTLRITIAKWFTPRGRDVTKEAIHPDVEVKMTAADLNVKHDPQLEKAIEILKKK